jgi:Na+-transporting methylmalonyl-CoA/oxaloacetate decarboxylase gamma subunit
VLAVLGMGGTLLVLYIFSLAIDLLKRLFPLEPEPPA